ncbi:peptidase S10 [Luteolibacter sp. GHJ8]|uniref:Peptidase S10 n=1 Tax=Luteolibacter rhizosphaerae TaxID=2989719 RepID=A0ABT3G958_9BACT|nr:peptidase S10 [Luteolibacter rhizosphaerae]MCW1916391.1 peptidase S10 [Luteolibacter rhizosphaerae]
MRPTLLLLALFTGLCTAQEKAPEAKPEPPKEENKEDKKVEPVTKEGSVTIGGKKIDYQVTTAKLTLQKDDGAPRASVFHVSYLKKNAGDLSKRPVLFAFNGGPGSSAVWLHLGTLGPKRVELPGDGTSAPVPPAKLVANEFSILDVADLVFVDPVTTGYSRVEKDGKPEEFHGVEGDVESLSDFIRRWVTENQRWNSPKYLLGESYGGIRVSGLASQLQSRYGMSLNGVVLLSSLLDFRTLSPSSGNDLAYQVFLPVYASVAHFHGKLKGDRDALVKEAQEFASGEYSQALYAGNKLDPAKKQAVAEKLSALTSLPASLILECGLRIDPTRFRGELLKKEGKVLGRFDARVAWPSTDLSSPYPEYDPSFSLALGAYSTAMLSYLSGELGWKEDSPYEILTGKVQPWKMGSGNGYVNMASRLATAMRDNPHLRILVMGGHADLATPPDGIAYSLSHMMELPESARKNIVFTQYEAGHMFYLNPPDLAKGRKDLVEFISAGEG